MYFNGPQSEQLQYDRDCYNNFQNGYARFVYDSMMDHPFNQLGFYSYMYPNNVLKYHSNEYCNNFNTYQREYEIQDTPRSENKIGYQTQRVPQSDRTFLWNVKASEFVPSAKKHSTVDNMDSNDRSFVHNKQTQDYNGFYIFDSEPSIPPSTPYTCKHGLTPPSIDIKAHLESQNIKFNIENGVYLNENKNDTCNKGTVDSPFQTSASLGVVNMFLQKVLKCHDLPIQNACTSSNNKDETKKETHNNCEKNGMTKRNNNAEEEVKATDSVSEKQETRKANGDDAVNILYTQWKNSLQQLEKYKSSKKAESPDKKGAEVLSELGEDNASNITVNEGDDKIDKKDSRSVSSEAEGRCRRTNRVPYVPPPLRKAKIENEGKEIHDRVKQDQITEVRNERTKCVDATSLDSAYSRVEPTGYVVDVDLCYSLDVPDENIIEVYGFTIFHQTSDLLAELEQYCDRNYFGLRFINDNHAVVAFCNPMLAKKVLSSWVNNVIKVRPLRESTKAIQIAVLQHRGKRPQTTATVARRLICAHLQASLY